MRLLVLLPYSPNKVRIRTLKTLEDLSSLFEIDLIYLNDGLPANIPNGIRTIKVIENQSKLKRALRLIYGLALGKPMTYQFYNNLGLPKILSQIKTESYFKIYIERLPFTEFGIPSDRVIFDIVDCFSDQVRQLSTKSNLLLSMLYRIDSYLIKKYEKSICNAASHVLVTTGLEAEKLRSLGITSNISPFLHGLQVDVCDESSLPDERFYKLSFHGKLSYQANLDALTSLNNLVAPNIPQELSIQVIGNTNSINTTKYSRLIFLGFIDDLRHALSRVDVSIFPMNVAVGIQNKVLESLALGVPVIVTPLIFRSLPGADRILNKGIFVATTSEFPNAIKMCYAHTPSNWKKFRINCLNYMTSIANDKSRRRLLWEIITS